MSGLLFLDADDLWRENHLKTLDDMIKKYPIDKVFTTSYIQSNQTETEKPNNTIDVIDNYFKAALERRVTWTSIMCANKEVFDKVGGFNIKLSRGEDLDVWARIGREYRYIKSNLITAVYRVEAENRSDLSFDLKKSRVFNYDFTNSASEEETIYYKTQIINTLRSFIIGRRLKHFWELKQKHKEHVSYMDILRK
jgi:hypothetical protein